MKTVCAGVLTSDYIKGAETFFKSLIYNNPKFNLTFYIFSNDETKLLCLKKIYSKIIFKKYNTSNYKNIKIFNKHRSWNYDVFAKLEMFKLKHEKVIYFDFDILVNGKINNLIKEKCSFGACQIDYNFNKDITSNKNYFNAGVLVIGKKYLNLETYQKLLELCLQQEWPGNELLLNVFFNTNVFFINNKYNNCTGDKINLKSNIIHFIGSKKPWHGNKLNDQFDRFILQKLGIIQATKLIKLYNFYSSLNKSL
jgi:lipopolysaccharide biosynthesis glycosyltransferase